MCVYVYTYIYIHIYVYTHRERARERQGQRSSKRERDSTRVQGYKGTRCPHIAECGDLGVYFVKDNFKSKQTKKINQS